MKTEQLIRRLPIALIPVIALIMGVGYPFFVEDNNSPTVLGFCVFLLFGWIAVIALNRLRRHVLPLGLMTVIFILIVGYNIWDFYMFGDAPVSGNPYETIESKFKAKLPPSLKIQGVRIYNETFLAHLRQLELKNRLNLCKKPINTGFGFFAKQNVVHGIAGMCVECSCKYGRSVALM